MSSRAAVYLHLTIPACKDMRSAWQLLAVAMGLHLLPLLHDRPCTTLKRHRQVPQQAQDGPTAKFCYGFAMRDATASKLDSHFGLARA